ncbi:uncharacterized protein LOC118434818 [Folsomia candida]|uniref:uncharacterized protein LOC118434818 n=1 Tax=Folsomia candida TaxID=158441 RepID=UPI0016054D9D|nr:uncharacterized protein LOC118434818 [Folsomia candida]
MPHTTCFLEDCHRRIKSNQKRHRLGAPALWPLYSRLFDNSEEAHKTEVICEACHVKIRSQLKDEATKHFRRSKPQVMDEGVILPGRTRLNMRREENDVRGAEEEDRRGDDEDGDRGAEEEDRRGGDEDSDRGAEEEDRSDEDSSRGTEKDDCRGCEDGGDDNYFCGAHDDYAGGEEIDRFEYGLLEMELNDFRLDGGQDIDTALDDGAISQWHDKDSMAISISSRSEIESQWSTQGTIITMTTTGNDSQASALSSQAHGSCISQISMSSSMSTKSRRLPTIDSVGSTQKRCFICNNPSGRKRIPKSAITQVWTEKEIFIPHDNRCCAMHLERQLFTDEAIELIIPTKHGVLMSDEELAQWILDLSSNKNKLGARRRRYNSIVNVNKALGQWAVVHIFARCCGTWVIKGTKTQLQLTCGNGSWKLSTRGVPRKWWRRTKTKILVTLFLVKVMHARQIW